MLGHPDRVCKLFWALLNGVGSRSGANECPTVIGHGAPRHTGGRPPPLGGTVVVRNCSFSGAWTYRRDFHSP